MPAHSHAAIAPEGPLDPQRGNASNARPTLRRRLALYASMLRYGRAHGTDFAHEHADFFAELRERLRGRVGDLAGRRVLDVGCGKTPWLTLLLHSAGARVTGVDTEWVEAGRSPAKYWRLTRANGFERAVRTLGWDLLYAPAYYRRLATVTPFPLSFEGLDVRRSSVTALDFPPATFDLVVSHEVFEHLPDVDGALRSLRRVLKPEGLTYVYVHSFTSLSGGHHIAWKYPDTEPSATVPPWDHLRENRYPDIPSWINRWRPQAYRAAFERQFEILEWIPTAQEGTRLLTPALREELSGYEVEELLVKGFIVIARPKRDAAGDPAP